MDTGALNVQERFDELGSKIMVLHEAGHIDESSGIKEIPEAVIELKAL